MKKFTALVAFGLILLGMIISSSITVTADNPLPTPVNPPSSWPTDITCDLSSLIATAPGKPIQFDAGPVFDAVSQSFVMVYSTPEQQYARIAERISKDCTRVIYQHAISNRIDVTGKTLSVVFPAGNGVNSPLYVTFGYISTSSTNPQAGFESVFLGTIGQ